MQIHGLHAYQMQQFKEGDVCSQGWPGTVPHQLFAMFQATFAIITPALIVGGLIDRIKFSALIIFVLLWGTFVYDPIAHWVWGGGYIGGGAIDLDPDLSPSYALDFAGGTVVHITSGFAALAGALVLGRRLGYGKVPMEPHNIPMVVLGASILWFGWFGFNAGSEVMVDGITVSAWTVTNTATGMASITWVLMSWAHTGKPSIVGAASGAVAGLVAITPSFRLGRSNGFDYNRHCCWYRLLCMHSIQECTQMGRRIRCMGSTRNGWSYRCNLDWYIS